MIDIHNHSLPGMDDGAKNIEMSIAMLEESARQGVTEIVLTPHMNHPLDFEPINDLVKEKVIQLREELDKKGIPLKLYIGAECYIQKKQLNELEQLPIKTLNDSDYILVEFDRSIHYMEMDHALHELKLRGLKPILAHVEVYQCLRKDMNRIQQLREQGYVIQSNASNFIGKIDNERSRFVKRLIEAGWVDIIASDHHNMESRPQTMEVAKAWITKHYMLDEAIRLMDTNPKAIINNQEIISSTVLPKRRTRTKFRVIVPFVILLVLCSIVIYSLTDNKNGQPIGLEEADNQGDEQMEDTPSQLGEDISSGVEEEDANVSQENDGIDNSIESEEPNEALDDALESNMDASTTGENSDNQSKEDGSAKDNTADEQFVDDKTVEAEALIDDYMAYFEDLQSEYMQEVDSYMVKFKALADVESEERQEALANEYLNQLGSAENESDNRVYKALYDMQNDLEALSYPVDIVEDIRARYHETKSRVSDEHEAQLRIWYNKVTDKKD